MLEFLNVSQAAKILNLSSSYVRNLERMGVLPAAAKLPDGMRLFNRSDVERFANERRRPSKHRKTS